MVPKRRKFLKMSACAAVVLFTHINGLTQQIRNKQYFVSPSGNDNSVGTLANPWRNLSVAINRALPYTEIVLLEGVYKLESKISVVNKTNLSIVGFAHHKVILVSNSAEDYSFLIGHNSNNIIFDNMTLIRSSSARGNVLGIAGNDVVIKNCLISFDSKYNPPQYDCIKILANNIEIRKCDIFNAPNQAIDIVGRKNIHVVNNKIHNSVFGIVAKGGSKDIKIENNYFYDIKHSSIGLGGTTDPRWHNYSNTLVEIEYATVRRNIIHYHNPNNIGGGISLKGAKNCIVINNTVYGAGIHIQAGGHPKLLNHHSSFNLIANNIIWRTGNDGILVVDKNNDTGLQLINNLYWKTSGSGEFKLDGEWHDYNEYSRLVKYDKGSIFSDPLFNNVDENDFSLMIHSPAIDQGVIIDKTNSQLQQIPDIGAIESNF